MPALTNAACRIVIKAIDPHRWEACGESGIRMEGRWAGESSLCEDPAPTVGIARRVMRRMRHRPSFTPKGHQWERRKDGITTRRAASLRPLRNGRIGFKPPYSKRGTAAKPPYGSFF